MAEKNNPPTFLVNPKSKALSMLEKEIFANPEKLFEADILKLSPNDPALASKVLISAYISHYSSKKQEILKKFNIGENDSCPEYDVIIQECTNGISRFLAQNEKLLSSHLSDKSEKGVKALWQWKNLKKQ